MLHETFAVREGRGNRFDLGGAQMVRPDPKFPKEHNGDKPFLIAVGRAPGPSVTEAEANRRRPERAHGDRRRAVDEAMRLESGRR